MTQNKVQSNDPLLTADNHALLLIDHQYRQLLAVRSHSAETVVTNTTLLARGAKIFNVPTLLRSPSVDGGGLYQRVATGLVSRRNGG